MLIDCHCPTRSLARIFFESILVDYHQTGPDIIVIVKRLGKKGFAFCLLEGKAFLGRLSGCSDEFVRSLITLERFPSN